MEDGRSTQHLCECVLLQAIFKIGQLGAEGSNARVRELEVIGYWRDPEDYKSKEGINPTKHRQISLMSKSPRGIMNSRQQGQLKVALWWDTKVVSLLSTCHQGYRDRAIHQLTRNIKNKGEEGGRREKIRLGLLQTQHRSRSGHTLDVPPYVHGGHSNQTNQWIC